MAYELYERLPSAPQTTSTAAKVLSQQEDDMSSDRDQGGAYELYERQPNAVSSAPQPAQQEEESGFSRAGRIAGQLGARSAEEVLGLPGNILSAGLGLANYATSGSVPTYESIQESLESRGIPHFPTSGQYREVVTKGLTGEALEPRSPGEEFAGRVVGEAAGAVPFLGGAIAKASLSSATKLLGKQLLRSASANLGAETVKQLGGGDLAQTATKLLLYSLPVGRNVPQQLQQTKQEAYRIAQEASANAESSVVPLEKSIEQHLRSLRGVKTAGSEKAAQILNDAKTEIDSGRVLVDKLGRSVGSDKIFVDDVVNTQKRINELIQSAQPKEVPYLKRALKPFNDFIQDYSKENPTFGKYFNLGEELHKGQAEAAKVGNWIFKRKDDVEKIATNPTIKALFTGGPLLGLFGNIYQQTGGNIPQAAVGTLGAAAAGTLGVHGAGQIAKFAKLVSTSPAAKRAYERAAIAATAENLPRFRQEIKRLNVAADNYDKANPVERKSGRDKQIFNIVP